jgi:O-antigen/teichoic acid export membrane protein
MLQGAFAAKLGVGLVVFAAAYASAPLVAAEVLRQPQMAPYLRIAYLGIVGMQLQNFYLAGFAGRLEFRRVATLAILAPLLILVAVSIAWWSGGLGVSLCLAIYAIAPLCASGFGVAVLSHRFLVRREGTARSIATLWRFSRWVYGSSVLGTVRFRLNSVLLSRLADIDDVGLFNYGDKLASVLSLFATTILTVFVPRTAHLAGGEELTRLLRRNVRWFLVLLPAVVVVPLAARPAIELLSPHYVAAAPIFTILFFSILFSLLALPSRAVLYSVDRPEVETAIEGIALVLALISGYVLIQSLGGMGAALSMLLQRVVSAGLTLAMAHRSVEQPGRRARSPREA